VFTLIGLYVGVLPVAIGLLWFPFLARLSTRGMDFLLALTIGLLAFLLIDGAQDGFEAAGLLPGSLQGGVLFALAAAGSYLLLEAVGGWLQSRRPGHLPASARSATGGPPKPGEGGRAASASTGGPAADKGGWVLSLMIAVGIGLHNFGEGLAIGSAFALGEAALGTLLIVGFTLHNTTEGLAIVAPLAREQRPAVISQLLLLGLIGGVPTIAGAWLGGLVYSPVWSVLFLALGVGAIAQVIVQIGRQVGGERAAGRFTSGPVLAGLAAGAMVMYVTGMMVG
jgi:zinc transporter ZupT